MKKYLFLVAILCHKSSNAQLSGTYTIGGVSPDYNSFTDAINDMMNVGISSSVIFNVRDGVYNESFNIGHIQGASLNHTVTFQSETGDSIACRLEAASNGVNPLWSFKRAWYLNWVGIGFRNSSPTNFSNLVEVDSGICRKLSFSHCHFSSANPGNDRLIYINTDSVYHFTVQHCFFDSSFSSLVLNANSYANDALLTDNYFNATQEAIHTVNCNQVVADNNIVHHPGTGIFIEGCDSVSVSNNRIDNSFYGIEFTDIYAATVLNNRITGTNNFGIYFNNVFDQSVRVNQNYIENVIYGIYLLGGNKTELSKDTIIHSNNAIEQDYSFAVNAHNNVIQDFSGVGMLFYATSAALKVTNNLLLNNDSSDYGSIGISWTSTNGNIYNDSAMVTNNAIAGTGSYGIKLNLVSATESATALIANNVITKFNQGIYAESLDNFYIAYNTIYNSGGNSPIFYLSDGSGNEVENNIFYGWSPSENYNLIQLGMDSAAEFDHNIYYYNDSGQNMNLVNFAHSLNDWQNMNHDIHSHFFDPAFINAPGYMYAYNCALSRKGVAMNQILKDITGFSRDSINPTPGAYEIYTDIASANFNYLIDTTTVQFQSTSLNATSYRWFFGDGDTSTLENPIHTYLNGGSYLVKLIADNQCNMDSMTQTIVVTPDTTSNDTTTDSTSTAIHLLSKIEGISISPNPTNGLAEISLPLNDKTDNLTLQVFDRLGGIIISQEVSSSQSIPIDMNDLSDGLYYIQLADGNNKWRGKVVKQK